jgi:hypothetical protein
MISSFCKKIIQLFKLKNLYHLVDCGGSLYFFQRPLPLPTKQNKKSQLALPVFYATVISKWDTGCRPGHFVSGVQGNDILEEAGRSRLMIRLLWMITRT